MTAGLCHVVLPPVVAGSRIRPPLPGQPLRRLQGDIYGTSWSLQAWTTLDSAALQALLAAEFAWGAQLFSLWHPESEICRVNRCTAGEVTLSPEFAQLLQAVLGICAQSGGAFDPTLGRLTAVWGFGAAPRPATGLPAAGALAQARAAGSWRDLQLDPETRVLRRPPGLWLDLNGSAKGAVVDRISRRLAGLGVHHLFEIGGDCRGLGLKPDLQPWWVDIDRAEPGAALSRVALNGWAMATSGDRWRHFVHQGRSFGHIFDPAGGAPRNGGPALATVLAPECWQADALATAFLLLPRAEAERFAESASLAVLLQYGGGACWSSPAFRAMEED